jgi:SAM-dependent methyltransferase
MDLGAPLGDVGVFDAVVARNVLMFVDDLHGALSRIRGALRPGGRLAALVWAELEDNPFGAIQIAAVRKRREMPTPPPDIVRAFSLSSAHDLRRAFEDAGFTSVVVERVAASRDFPSCAQALKVFDEIPLHRDLLALLPEEQRREAVTEIEQGFRAFVRADGTVAFPMVSFVAAGSA